MEKICLKVFVWLLGFAAFTGTVSSCSSIDDVGNGGSVDEETDVQEPGSLGESLILDMVFNRDGTAVDASGSGISVKSLTTDNVMVYYNNVLEGYVPRFSNEPGAEVTSGYYRAEYYVDRGLRADLQDGFTLEAMFLLDSGPGNVRMSVLSSEEQGGAGIYVGAKDIANEIAFDMYVDDAGAQRLVTLRSGVVPEAGKAYHVVAAWSSERSEASLYVDGEQKAVFGTSGGFALPANVADQWFGVGCDAGPSASGQYPFKGDIYSARIYGEPAVASQAEALWTAADKDIESSIVSVDGLMLFPVCGVCPGYRYMILGSGFRQGDRVKMVQISDMDQSMSVECDTYPTHISFSIPDGVVDGNYGFYLVREGAEAPLGIARLEVDENPSPLAAPGIIAHRGYHTLPGAAENSLAALKAAQDLGIYGCEIDVWTTTDGVIVVHHDGILSGKTIQNSTYDEVKDLKLSNGETLPLFTDMLEAVRTGGDTKLIIEIKEHSSSERNNAVTDETLRLVTEAGLDDKVEYICFSRDVCRRIVNARPDAMVGYLSGDTEPADIASDGIMCIDYPFATLNTYRYMVSDAHALGMKVNIWTVNTDEDMMSSISLGVDYITTDHPDRLLEICGMMEE